MADIAPFRGIRYVVERIGTLEPVVAPPYDVISPEQRAALVEGNHWNIVQIDLPVGIGDLKYTYAGQLWRQWHADGILRHDPVPALYLLEETFRPPFGQPGQRIGFVAALRLEELGKDGVRPHERTFAGPKADRLKLMETTHANLSQVFVLYRDPGHRLDAVWERVMRQSPDAAVSAPDGKRRMWVVTDPDHLSVAQEVLSSSSLTIADGHHRYETAITYRNACRERGAFYGAEFVMVYLSSMDDPHMAILPTHRLVKLSEELDMAEVRTRIERHFDLEPVVSDHPDRWLSDLLSHTEGEPYQFGLFTREWGWMLATLRSWDEVADMIDPERSDAWRHLDVAVLHEVLLRGLAVASEGDANRVTYTPDAAKGHTLVANRTADLLCMLRPATAHHITDVADAGDMMPQKSTYFYPKLLTGLAMRSLD